MVVKVEVRGIDEVKKALDRVPTSAFKIAKKAFAGAALRAQKNVVRRITVGPLHSRSGNLARSINVENVGNKIETLKSSVFSASSIGGEPVVYAPVHEFGATIKARKAYRRVPGGPYLNIPLDANKTAAGVTRRSARDVFQAGGTLRKSRSGNWIVFSSNWQPMFVLKKQVTIPARLGMRDAAEAEVKQLIDDLNGILDDV